MAGRAKIGLWRGLTAAACIAAALAGCAAGDPRPDEAAAVARKPPLVRSGYACCNLHHNGNVIGDANSAQLPFIPAGTPVTVRRIDSARADLEIEGKSMQFALAGGGGTGPTAQEWVDKIVVADDPRQRMERYPASVRNAIRAGQVMKGMTQEQVTMALGYPQEDPAKPGTGKQSRYWWTSFVPFYVHWAKNGTVARVEGPAEALAQLLYKGR
jgi:hypothetical protein